MTVTAKDYPLAERRPDLVAGASGRGVDSLTLDAILAGDVTLDDLRISARSLRLQAEIARASGRATLAANFERAAELTALPQDTIMALYEQLRPGRARSAAELLATAASLRAHAPAIAALFEEAAAAYARRGLFGPQP